MKFMAAFRVAHDQGTEEQASQQDSHGGEAEALDSGSARKGEVRGRSGGARKRAGWLLQFRAEAPRSPVGRARGDQAPQARPSFLSRASGVPAQPGPASGGRRMDTGSGDSAAAAAEPEQPG